MPLCVSVPAYRTLLHKAHKKQWNHAFQTNHGEAGEVGDRRGEKDAKGNT